MAARTHGADNTTPDREVHRVSGHLMLGLALFAMLLVVAATLLTALGRFSPSSDGDEGTAAHLFQLSIVLLVPTGFTFLATANWHHPARAVKRLALPAAALVVAFSTLYYMEHLQ